MAVLETWQGCCHYRSRDDEGYLGSALSNGSVSCEPKDNGRSCVVHVVMNRINCTEIGLPIVGLV